MPDLRPLITDVRNGITAIAAFARKEIQSVLRQPRLLLTMILGPFLILALFGLGYRQQSEPLATIFVTTGEGEFARQLEERAAEFDDDIVLLGTVSDTAEAARWLRSGDADVAVVVPENPIETIRAGERSTFLVLHDQLDPFEQATISLVARGTVDLVNRRILEQLIQSGQTETADLETLLPQARDNATAMRIALEAGDTPAAEAYRSRLADELELINTQSGSTEILFDNIWDEFESATAADDEVSQVGQVAADLESVDFSDGESLDEEIETARRIEERLEFFEANLADFRSVPPSVLVSPFGVDTEVVGAPDLDITSFYAPGVIALLIQHIGITFAGLSLVRERALGTPEMFRVSPIYPAQILAGKYLGYLGAIAVVAVALSVLMFGVFGVPLAGSMSDYALVLALLALVSLGIGFVISSFATSDTQAVNLSMIMLLLSVFFSGFFLSLDRIIDWVRAVSWTLPITHAIDSLRDVMFRGGGIDLRTVVTLGAGSIVLFVVANVLLSRGSRAA